MNERIQALLRRLADDPALRARFVENGRMVMDEAGLAPVERAEAVRHVDVNGNPHPGSIVPTEEVADIPEESGSTPVGSSVLL